MVNPTTLHMYPEPKPIISLKTLLLVAVVTLMGLALLTLTGCEDRTGPAYPTPDVHGERAAQDAEAAYKASTAVPLATAQKWAAEAWEAGAQCQAELVDQGGLGWFHISHNEDGTETLYRPVWTTPRPRDPIAENEKFQQEEADKGAKPSPTPRKKNGG